MKTSSYIDRSGIPIVISAAEDKLLIIESKRNGRKTAPKLTAELLSSRQQEVSIATVKIRLRSTGNSWGFIHQEAPVTESE